MRLEAALVDHWRRDAEVIALAKTAEGRVAIVRGTADPGQPAGRLHYTLQSDAPEQSLSGGETASRLARIRLEAFGRSRTGYEDARALLDAALASTGGVTGGPQLRRFRGWLPAGAPAGQQVFVQACRVEQVEGDGEEPPLGGGYAKSWFTAAADLVVSYLGQ